MSYILEALKKAETERRSSTMQAVQRSSGLDALGYARTGPRRQWPWLASAAVTVAAGIAGAAWLAVGSPPTQAPPPADNPPPRTTVATLPAEPVALPPAETPVTPPEKVVAKTPEKKRQPVKEDSKTESTKTSYTPERRDDAPIATLRQLPEHVQRELPALAIGGYIYSANRSDRSVLINKRLLREGDEISPGLTLEEMAPGGMVMNYKGYRFRSSY